MTNSLPEYQLLYNCQRPGQQVIRYAKERGLTTGATVIIGDRQRSPAGVPGINGN